MKNKATFILALLIIFSFLFYAVTFQVDFNEAAVKSRFGSVHEGQIYFGDRPETGALGNLHFRLPWPIDQVTTYDQRVRVLEGRLEELQTADGMTATVSAYVTWRIADPLAFYRSVADETAADRLLRSRVRDQQAVISNYTFDELTNEDPEQIRLGDVEQELLERLQASFREDAEEQARDMGIAIESVGIRRVVLPEDVTRNVFERMRVTRERLAQRALSEGEASAANIRARAEGSRRTILAFAQRRADAIRAEGAEAAAQYYEVFRENEDFAIFLLKLDAYREIFRHNTTFLIDAKEGGLGGEFFHGPQVPMERMADAGEYLGNPSTSGDSSSNSNTGNTGNTGSDGADSEEQDSSGSADENEDAEQELDDGELINLLNP